MASEFGVQTIPMLAQSANSVLRVTSCDGELLAQTVVKRSA